MRQRICNRNQSVRLSNCIFAVALPRRPCCRVERGSVERWRLEWLCCRGRWPRMRVCHNIGASGQSPAVAGVQHSIV